MKFEKAKEADKEEILQLYRSLVGTTYCAWTDDYPSPRDIEGDMSRNALFCLRDKEHDIIGVISIDKDEAVEILPCWSKQLQPSAELSRLGVKAEYQNKGIARKLLQYGMEELKKQGKKSVHFLVCKTNQKAIRSYDKLQFDIVGECELFGESFWCYEKAL
mgnify:CR=1 FL=1